MLIYKQPLENTKDPQPIQKCFEKGLLKSIVAKAHLIRQLELELQQLLPGHLKSCCRVANVHGTQLIVQVQSASWAIKLRYQTPELIKQLPAITAIQVTVRPS